VILSKDRRIRRDENDRSWKGKEKGLKIRKIKEV